MQPTPFCTDNTASLVESTALPASAQIGNERREAEVLLSPRATAGEVRKGKVLALGGTEGLGWSSAAEILALLRTGWMLRAASVVWL